MTKLAVMSDLHIDINQFGDFEIQTLLRVLQEEKIDWLHIAGDIANHYYETALPFLEKIAAQVKLTYNLGNHDMLDLTEETIEKLDFQTYQLGKITMLAFHGWYDYSFHTEKSDQENARFKNIFWFDRRLDRTLPDKKLTEAVCRTLEQKLSQLPGRLLIAMHFVPHSSFIMTHPRFAPFNAFLGSQKFHYIFRQYKVTDVVFGHAHRSYGTQKIDGISYHSRPLGYLREWDLTIDFVNQHPEYNPSGTWNLSKRYNAVKHLADFLAYKNLQLEQEFRKAMTIFDV